MAVGVGPLQGKCQSPMPSCFLGTSTWLSQRHLKLSASSSNPHLLPQPS